MTQNDYFDQFLCERSDFLDNTVQMMLTKIVGEEMEWDISIIRETLDTAIACLAEKGFHICNPYFYDVKDTPRPCYLREDNDCDMEKCPMRKR